MTKVKQLFAHKIGTFVLHQTSPLIIYAFVSWITGHVVAGWSSSFISTTLIGGIQLISLGVIGEYVGKIYMETKSRPRYIIEERKGLHHRKAEFDTEKSDTERGEREK